MASSDQERQRCCFREWMSLQQEDLSELIQGLNLTLNPTELPNNHLAGLSQLAGKNIQHFQDYVDRRSHLARTHVSPFFAPPWCTSLETSLLWIAGCRPSMFIRLVYALCGSQVEAQLTEFLRGATTRSAGTGNLSGLSGKQLTLVNGLQGKTIKEEEKLSSRMASLQEDTADQPLALIAVELSLIGELSSDTDKALDDHAESMASVLEEADQLRLRTLKELIGILSPLQAVEYLAASKRLHLCIHEWGKKRDHIHGRN